MDAIEGKVAFVGLPFEGSPGGEITNGIAIFNFTGGTVQTAEL